MEERQDPNPDPPQEDAKDQAQDLLRFFREEKPATEDDNAMDENDDDEDDDGDDIEELDRILQIEELEKQAYFYVLRAFLARSSCLSSSRIIILNQLTKEFTIPYKQHEHFLNTINNESFIRNLRKESQAEIQKNPPATEDKPSASQDKNKEKATPSSPRLGQSSSRGSWGNVSPESLVGRKVFIRLPGDNELVEFMIKKYDSKMELHSLETAADTMDDPCSWIDLRHIPSKDIMWEVEDTEMSEAQSAAKSQESWLHMVSTTERKGGSEDNVFKIKPKLPSNYAAGKKSFIQGDESKKADAAGESSIQLSLSSIPYDKSDETH